MSDKHEEIFESEPEITTKSEEVAAATAGNKRVEVENEDIIRTTVDVSDAFEVFSGKLYDNKSSLVHNRDDYSLTSNSNKKGESPMQRYARLKVEIDELQQDLDEVLREDHESITGYKETWKVLRQESDNLKGKLLGLERHKFLNPPGKLNDSKDIVYDTLDTALMNIDDYAKSNTGSASASATSNLTYDEQQVLENIQLLEKRITGLEKLIGTVTSAVDVRSASVFPLNETVARLERRVESLDEECLNKIAEKYKDLNTEVDTLNKDKTKSAELISAAEKIDGLKIKMDSVSAVANCLPDVIVRFKSLESIHQGAAEILQRVIAAEQNVANIKETGATNAEVLDILTEGMKENIELMKKNMQAMDKKIAKATGEGDS